MSEVRINAPRLWWRISASEAHRFAFNDVELNEATEKDPRYANHADTNWFRIARAVAFVGDALARGDWSPEDNPGFERYAADIEVDLSEFHLAPHELKHVRGWFNGGNHPNVDPMDPALIMTGRTPLFLAVPHFGNELIPLQSNDMTHLDRDNVKMFVPTAKSNLEQLESLTWFDRQDPVNKRYILALEEAASGYMPAVV